MPKHLYIVRGAPASGKTNLTPLLATHTTQPTALIEQDNWRWGIHLVGRSIPDIKKEEHHFADKIMLHTLEQYLRTNKYTVIIEGSFAWSDPFVTHVTVQDFISLSQKYNYLATSIVLKADKTVLKKRNNARKYTVPRDEFNNLYDAIYREINPKEILVDSTNLTKEATLAILKDKLSL